MKEKLALEEFQSQQLFKVGWNLKTLKNLSYEYIY